VGLKVTLDDIPGRRAGIQSFWMVLTWIKNDQNCVIDFTLRNP
jgi:hypothetical protein